MRIAAIVILYLLVPFCIVCAFRKWTFVQKVGSVVVAYAIGILFSLSGLTTNNLDVEQASQLANLQKWFMNLTVPLAIPLMLLSSDFRLWAKTLPKTVFALVGGLLSVLLAVILGFFVFRGSTVENFENLSAMMVGIYTGGTMNFAALGAALQVDSTVMTCLMTFEMLGTFPLLLFVVCGGYRMYRKLLPFPEEDGQESPSKRIQDNGVECYDNMLHRRIFPLTMQGLLLSISFLALGAGLSLLITGKLHEMVVILTVTTLAIIASFNDKIRRLPKTFELGMIFILQFSVVVASQFNFYILATSGLTLLYYVLFVMVVSMTLHILFCRLFKVYGDLFVVANIGLLCSPPFIPPVVGVMGNKKVLVSGLAIGLVGYAIGTYLGIAMSYILHFL